MKKLFFLTVVVVLALGFYKGYFKLDPIAAVLLCVLLWNNREFSQKQDDLAVIMKKAHEVSAANDREIVKRIEGARSDIRTRKI